MPEPISTADQVDAAATRLSLKIPAERREGVVAGATWLANCAALLRRWEQRQAAGQAGQ